MRALLILLALLLALPAAALELLPTTLQLPPKAASAELWLTTPARPLAGPGAGPGVGSAAGRRTTAPQRPDPGQPGAARPGPGSTQRVWLLPGDPPAAAAEQAYRVVLAPTLPGLPRYSLPLFRGQPRHGCRPAAWVDPGSQAVLRLSNTGTLHGRLHDLRFITAERTLLRPAWPAICWPAMSAAGPCPPAPMATPAAISRPACRTAAWSIWPLQTRQLQQAPSGL
jgi:fimbrial chaperone protein